MAFKTTLFVCGLVLSIQNAYSQVVGLGYNGLGFNNGLGFGNAFAPSYGAIGGGEVEITAVEIESTGLGAAYGYGGLGNVGALGIGAAGIGSGFGVAGLGNVGLGGVTVANAPLAANNAFLNLGSWSAGGVLPISSYGPIVPGGLTVVSDNIIEGTVVLDGQLPFLSAVAFDGAFPSGGSGLSQCGCGSAGNIGIISETVTPVASAANLGGLGWGNLGGLGGLGRVLY